MTRTALALAACAFLSAVTVAAQDRALVTKGQEVYLAQKCALCHSVSGKGNAKGALDGVGSKYKPDELRDWLANPKLMSARTGAVRKPPMKDFSALSKSDIEALVAYLQTLKK